MTSTKPPSDEAHRSSSARIPNVAQVAHPAGHDPSGRLITADTLIDVIPSQRTIYRIRAGHVFDSVARALVPDQLITVDGHSGVILDICAQADERNVGDLLGNLLSVYGAQWGEEPVDVVDIDMSSLTVLPGLVDTHDHFFLHAYTEASSEQQMTGESVAERTVRATVHARKTLLAGFTTVRDLGTEGAFDADIGLRKCLAGRNAVIPGPRYYCVTRAINSTGAYGPKSELYPAQEGIDGVKGAEPVDGIDNCVREVRRQIGAGADWIKIYADYTCRSRTKDVSVHATDAIATFNKEELKAMIDTAHARGVKVAAHSTTAGVIRNLLELGVDTIEHGTELYDPSSGDITLIRRFSKAKGATIWVPTLAVMYVIYKTSLGTPLEDFAARRWHHQKETFQAALRADMENIACGGDTGAFPHGENALELILMRQLGAPWERVLGWATYGGWKCVRGMEWEGASGAQRLASIERDGVAGLARTGWKPDQRTGLERGVPFGVLRAGWAADLVGVQGKVDGSPEEFEDALARGVRFVMKGGRIYKYTRLGN